MRTSTAIFQVLAAISLMACSPPGRPDAAQAKARAQEMWKRIGVELARESVACGPAGKVLLVRMSDQSRDVEGPQQIESSYRENIAKLMNPEPEVEVLSVDDLPVPSSAPPSVAPPRRELEPSILAEAILRAGPNGLVVSLLGEPAILPPENGACPPIICFAPNGHTNLARAIRSGCVRAAIAPRHTDAASDEKNWFELRYTVLRPDTIGAW